MNKFLVSAMIGFALTAGSAVAADQQRGQPAQPSQAEPQVGQTAPQTGQHALIGMQVVGQGDEEIGEITNVLVDEQGQVYAVIVRRGTAVLGIGGDEVALPFDGLQLPEARDGAPADERQARIDMTEEQFGELPAYEGEREIRDNLRAPGMQPGRPPEEQPGRRQPDTGGTLERQSDEQSQ